MSEEKKIEDVINFLEVLNNKIDEQGKRIEKLENASGVVKGVGVAPPPPPSPSSPPTIIAPEKEFTQEQTEAISYKNIPETQTSSPSEKVGMEENIGGKWFARIGITALVLGVSFFLKYAFDNDWIGETSRVIIGIIIGLTLLGLGEKYIRKYFVYGQIISGGGIAILYLSVFSAFNFYHLIGQLPAFFMMIFITTIGIILSLRYNAISLMIVSTLGGFVTPLLVSNGQNNQIGLLSYILMLDIAILVISVFKKWRGLNFLGFFGTVLIFSLWAGEFYTTKALGMTMFFLTAFFIVYSISSLIYNLVKKEKSSSTEQILTLFSATAYFGISYALLNDKYHEFMGFFTLILAIYYFLWAYLVKALTPEDSNLYDFLAFLTVGFVTLAIPIQFEKNIITICWLIEALVLFFLGIKTATREIKVFGFVVFCLSLLRLIYFDSTYSENSLLVTNQVFGIFIFATIIAYIVAYLFHSFAKDNETDVFFQSKKMVAIFVILANILTIFAISREINYYYEEQVNQIRVEQRANNADIRLRKSIRNDMLYDNTYSEKIKKIKSVNSVTLSIFWLIYSIILLIVGIAGKYKNIRVGGLVLLMVAILKLFFYDLWNLGTLYRIISSISLGVVLLSISFVYQKYKDKIKEII